MQLQHVAKKSVLCCSRGNKVSTMMEMEYDLYIVPLEA